MLLQYCPLQPILQLRLHTPLQAIYLLSDITYDNHLLSTLLLSLLTIILNHKGPSLGIINPSTGSYSFIGNISTEMAHNVLGFEIFGPMNTAVAAFKQVSSSVVFVGIDLSTAAVTFKTKAGDFSISQ